MNELYVNVKVDREERPDVDAVYMDAVQALTGRGGWPMTVFMTPDRQPFYGGTYFPKPQFLALLTAVDDAYRNKPDELRQNIGALAKAIDTTATIEPADELPDVTHLNQTMQGLGRGLRPRLGRVRPGPEVPVDVPPRADVAGLHDHRRRGPAGHRGHHARRHGVGRDVRPHRWGFRPLLGRSRMARAALREDALRPGTARARRTCTASSSSAGRRWRQVLGETITYVLAAAAASRRRLLLGGGRGLARCRRARRGGAVPHVDARRGPCGDGRSARRRPDGGARLVRHHRRGQFRGSVDPEPAPRPRRARAAAAHRSRTTGAVRRPRNGAAVPGSTTRCSPSGTRCSCRPWPKPAPRSDSRSGSTRRSPTASSCSANCAGRTGAGGGVGRPTVNRRRATTRSPPTTPPSSTPSRGSRRPPGRPAGSTRRVRGRRHDARVVLGSGERRPLHDCRGRRTAHRPPEGPDRQRHTVGELDGGDRAATASRPSPASSASPTTPTGSCS